MNDENDEGGFDDQSRALRSLKEGPQPPRGLEERVISALGERGMLRGGPGLRSRWRPVLTTVAASLLLFAVGAAVGFRLASEPGPPRGDRFVLFLYEGSDFQAAAPGTERERVEEYRTWARELSESGHLVAGEKLKEGEEVLGGPAREAGPGTVGGYFVIAARDVAQARTIASGCPHLRYGGRIVLRQIDPV